MLDVYETGELDSVLEVLAPDIEHHFEETDDGQRMVWMLHADGSWASATARGDEPPTVHRGGPRRSWDILDDIRRRHGVHHRKRRDTSNPRRLASHHHLTPDGNTD